MEIPRIKLILKKNNESQFQVIFTNIITIQFYFNSVEKNKTLDFSLSSLSTENYISLITTKCDEYVIENLTNENFPIQTFTNISINHYISDEKGMDEEWRISFTNEE